MRLIAVSVVSLLLCGVLAVQSAAIALTHKAPATSTNLFPANGLASEVIASALFVAAAAELMSPEVAARDAEEWARKSYKHEPLTPESHAILAYTVEEHTARSNILKVASGLNRRETRLQAVVFQEQVAAKEYLEAIATLDRILRVRPSSSQSLFPVLLPVFVQEGSSPQFAEILDGSSPWHQEFVRYAIGQPAALLNLVELRKRTSFDDVLLDRALLRNLVEAGEVELAYTFYTQLRESGGNAADKDWQGWTSTSMPFEWQYVEQTGMRAQPTRDSRRLEISVRPGKGGAVARRVFPVPITPFRLEVDFDDLSDQALQDIDLSARCANGQSLLAKTSLADLGNSYRFNGLPDACSFVEVIIYGRAWTGRSSLNAELNAVRLTR